MYKVFLVEDEVVVREGIKIKLTGKVMDTSFAEKPVMVSLRIRLFKN